MAKRTPTQSTALATIEPDAEQALEVTDQTIATVVAGIRAAQAKHGFALAQDIGRLIVDKFHGGDMAAFRSRGAKDASLRKLAQHPDLPMSAAALQQAVAVFDYLELHPRVYASIHLTPTHIRAVLSLPPPEQERLLAKAENKALTVAQLAEEARKAKAKAPKRSKGGRKALPRFVKSIRALRKYADGGDELFGDVDAVQGLAPKEQQALLRTVRSVRARLDSLEEMLTGGVEA